MYEKKWKVSKRMEIAGCHYLSLPYPSKCENLHGHNWIVTVHCVSDKLNYSGMVVDFTLVKQKIHDYLDHGNINELLPGMNPTAENMAKWICDEVTDLCQVGYCYKVEVQESEGNIAVFERGVDYEG